MRSVIVVSLGILCLLSSSGNSMAQSSDKQTSDKSDEKVYSAKEVDKKVVLKSKPEARYTDEACKKGVVGEVVLKSVFAASGKVTNLEVLKGLPEGLTESAIEAAQKIKFKPAMKGGQRVSVFIELHYNFNWDPLPCD
jgi:protein TonB